MKYTYLLQCCFLITLLSACQKKEAATKYFVKVNGIHLETNGTPYHFLGTNFWYGLNLGSKGAGGDRERLLRELDQLKDMGVTNLRIMAGSEGPDTEPYRMVPALQTAPGQYNQEVVDGLDFLLYEMRKRGMYAVVCLNNFWNWSGGMGQYLVWSGAADSIPYPPPAPNGDWGGYQDFTVQFYSNEKAMSMFDEHIRYIVGRTNTYSDLPYKEDPTIMAWELANEPRGGKNTEAFQQWLTRTSGLIKELDSTHLVTVGSEGRTSSPTSGTDLITDHSDANIDYTTIHIWVQNWEIYNPAKADSTFEPAVAYATNYIDDHIKMARQLNKPIVLEEFGISRDLNDHDPGAPVTVRNKYYQAIFQAVYDRASRIAVRWRVAISGPGAGKDVRA